MHIDQFNSYMHGTELTYGSSMTVQLPCQILDLLHALPQLCSSGADICCLLKGCWGHVSHVFDHGCYKRLISDNALDLKPANGACNNQDTPPARVSTHITKLNNIADARS